MVVKSIEPVCRYARGESFLVHVSLNPPVKEDRVMDKVHIGVDIAKDKFDVYALGVSGKKYSTFANTSKGHRAFLKYVASFEQPHVVMEATGNYHLLLADQLEQAGHYYSVVNPLQIKRFAQMKLARIKSDASDCRLIAEYAAQQHPPRHQGEPVARQKLKQINTLIEQLIQTQTRLLNQRHAFSFLPHPDRLCTRTITRMIKQINKQVSQLQTRQQELIDAHYVTTQKLALSVKGIGPRTVVVLICLLGDLSRFSNAKQVAAFIGINPVPNQSGLIENQAHISKQGHAKLRTLFYLCALSAVRHNKECKRMYARLLGRGKKKKVALIAVANKLIRQVFAVIKSGVPFDDDYVEKMVVKA